jgi:hypothetical protein
MARIKVQVGDQNFGHGLTTVTLEADGSIIVENVRKLEVKRKLTERVLSAKVEKVFEHAQIKDIFKLPKPRTLGLPDEARYKVEINQRTFEVWDGDLAQNPQLDALVSLLKELVNQSTNGEVVL